jgi:two-component system response regulator RegX3
MSKQSDPKFWANATIAGRSPRFPAAMTPRILLVEDDPAIAEPLVQGLTREGFEVTLHRRGRDVITLAERADLVLLDLGLPDMDGKEVCRALRAISNIPIIVVTARGDEIDRVVLLELGADDYLVKPFGFRELVARMGAVMRRTGRATVSTVAVQQLGALVIDRDSRRVLVAGDEIALTPKEFDLLSLLAERPGSVRSREDIIDNVWDTNWFGPTKTLDVHIAALRRKLGHPEWIVTLRGVGYRLEAPQ